MNARFVRGPFRQRSNFSYSFCACKSKRIDLKQTAKEDMFIEEEGRGGFISLPLSMYSTQSDTLCNFSTSRLNSAAEAHLNAFCSLCCMFSCMIRTDELSRIFSQTSLGSRHEVRAGFGYLLPEEFLSADVSASFCIFSIFSHVVHVGFLMKLKSRPCRARGIRMNSSKTMQHG